MTRVRAIIALVAGMLTSGCGTACGPVRTVPAQKLSIAAPSPASYTIRIQPAVGPAIDTPVPQDGKLTFNVPVTSRNSTMFFLFLPVCQYPPPETLRVIRVMRDNRTIRNLSARDIALLPVDADGHHVLRIEK